MQTTLLGLAIALILALLAALVGPFFIDWNAHRPRFEAEASRLVGLPVRVGGAIDVRLLPTPTLLLNGVEIGPRGDDALRARSLGIEFALGSLVRGQLRASQTRIVGPQLTVVMNADGRASLPSGGLGFDAGDLVVDHLHVEDARLSLVHAASNRRFVFDKLWFDGEVRSLAGSFRGEGAFVSDKDLYGYRINAVRQESGQIRLRFNLDPSERALNAEGEGTITTENGAPKFEGNVTFIRPVGTVLASGRAVVNEPLRLTSKVKVSASSALFEQIEFQYGPDERALKIGGTAELKLGARPRLDGVLSAGTLDIDRLSASSGQLQRAPIAAMRALAESFGGALSKPLPMKIGFSADTVTLGGAPLQNLRGDLTSDGDGIAFESAQFRAPGFTEVTFSGKAALSQSGFSFTGPADIASADPRLLIRWLDGRDDPAPDRSAKPIRLRANIAIGDDKIAFERLRAEIDRKTVDGRIVYLWPTDARKARLDAELKAAELDVDSLLDYAQTALGSAKLERPGEISLAIDIGRATIAGIEARNANAKLTLNPDGLTVERVSLGEFGGVSLNASGRMSLAAAPRGNLSVDLDARDLSGLSALLTKFAPGVAEPVRRVIERMGASKLRATLDVEDAPEKGRSFARVALNGQSGGLRVALKADATGDHANMMQALARVDATIETDDSAQMFRLTGLDRAAAVAKGPGKFSFNAQGPLDGAIKLNSRLTSAEGLDGRVQGTMTLSSEAGVSGQFDLAVGNADLSWLRTTPGERVTAALTSRVSTVGRQFKFENAMASIAGTPLRGKLDMDFTSTPRITGQIDADMIDAAAIIGGIAGLPARADGTSWPAEPFMPGYLGTVTGRIAVSAAQASIGQYLVKDLRTSLRLDPSGLSAEAIEGEIADGKLSGEISLRKAAEGLNLKARLGLQNVDAQVALPLENNPLRGRLGLQFDVEGMGLSPKALIGSLAGNGTVSLERASVSGLDPRVFPTVMRAADRGLQLEPAKIRDAVTPWIDSGALEIAHADGVIAIAGGQVRLPTLIARAKGADVSASGNLDLVNSVLDARVALTGTASVASSRPEIIIQLRGPLSAPKRNVDVASLAGWLALRAVDQQSKTLEAIEQGRGITRDPPQSIPDSEIIPDAPLPDRNITLPRPRVKAPEVAPAQRPAALERAAPLPPPLEIGPPPGARRPLPTRPQAISPPAERNTF